MAFNLSLNIIKAALVAALTSKSWHTEICNGRITASELKKFSHRAPGILVTVLNVDGWEDNSQTVAFAAFTLGKDTTQLIDGKRQPVNKGDIAEALAMIVMDVVLENPLPNALKRPEQFRAQNLYSGGVHDQGAALWGVTWKQQFDLKPDHNNELVEMIEVWLRPAEEHSGPYAEATIDVSQPQGEQP